MTRIAYQGHSPASQENSNAKSPGRLTHEHTVLAMAHLGLADALARRYCPPGADWCDIQQVARIGLLKAALRFRDEPGATFVAFAVPTVCGEIKRYLRDHGWFVRPPRRIQDLRQELRRASPAFAQQLGREPTAGELAEALAVGRQDVEEALLSESSVRLQSLDAAGSADDRAVLYEHLGRIDDAFALVDDRVSLRGALHELTPRELRLLSLRFQEELKQREIAELLNISQMQVSRALSAVLSKLRHRMGEDWTPRP